MLGLGERLDELKRQIQKAQLDLAELGTPEQPLPEMINTTNVLRVNEYLIKSDENKTKIISAYEEYTKQLEQIIAALLSIQSDLREIIKTEASIISKPPKKPRKAAKRTKKKKKR